MAARLIGLLLVTLAVQQTGQPDATNRYAQLDATLFRAIGDRTFDDQLQASPRVLTPDVGAVEVWQRLRGMTDPVIRAIADELDGVPRVYMAMGVHPRTFTPR